MLILDKYKEPVKSLCQQYKVKSLYLFGSAMTDDFSDKSDIDFIVDFEDMDIEKYADNYFDLKFSLEHVFHRSIDLLEEKAIKNPYFHQAIASQKRLVYEC